MFSFYQEPNSEISWPNAEPLDQFRQFDSSQFDPKGFYIDPKDLLTDPYISDTPDQKEIP